MMARLGHVFVLIGVLACRTCQPSALSEDPGERDLRGCRLLPFGDLAEQIHQGLIRSSVLRREARDDIAKIGLIELRFFVDLAREEPFS